MLWQGCSLSPRELERKAPRSVWATQLPASRPIRWIVHESREANRTDSPAFYRRNFARAPARQSDGLTFVIPSPAFPRTDFARIRKTDADSTISQPRCGHDQPPLNHNLFRTIQQPLSNPAPTIGNLNPSSSLLQPPRNREPITTTPQSFPDNNPAARSRQTDDPALGKHPRLNHPSCRIQERFRHNHPTFAILCSRVSFVIFSEAP